MTMDLLPREKGDKPSSREWTAVLRARASPASREMHATASPRRSIAGTGEGPMREPGASVRDLPGAKVRPSVSVWWGGAAVFLDYDGTLTPIADRPQDAVISASKRTSSWRSRPLDPRRPRPRPRRLW